MPELYIDGLLPIAQAPSEPQGFASGLMNPPQFGLTNKFVNPNHPFTQGLGDLIKRYADYYKTPGDMLQGNYNNIVQPEVAGQWSDRDEARAAGTAGELQRRGLVMGLDAMTGGMPFAQKGAVGAMGGRLVQTSEGPGITGGMSRPKFEGDRFNAYVVVDPTMSPYERGTPRYSLGADGALEMRVPPSWTPGTESYQTWQNGIFRFLDETLEPKYDHYWRFTNNPKEIDLLHRGAIRPSYNFADNFAESGLSVATGPHYAVQPYKYGYGIKGEKVGLGSDGEVLLNPKSSRAVTEIMPKTKIIERDLALAKEIMKRFGWSPEDMSRLVSSGLRFIPHDHP